MREYQPGTPFPVAARWRMARTRRARWLRRGCLRGVSWCGLHSKWSHSVGGFERHSKRCPSTWLVLLFAIASFNHLVGAGEQRRWNVYAKRLGGDQVDDQVEFGRLLHWYVGRLRPAQNLVDILGGPPEKVREVWPIGHQTSRFDILPLNGNRWQSCAHRQNVDANPVGVNERVASNIKCIGAALERLDGGHDVLPSPDFQGRGFEAQRAGRCQNLGHLRQAEGIVRIAQNRQSAERWDDRAQQLDSLGSNIGRLQRQASDVAARLGAIHAMEG